MTGSREDTTSQRIGDALKPLISDDAVRDHTASDIRKSLEFLNWKPPPGARFFDFTAKVNDVVRHFAPDGLTRAAYLEAALKQPSLLTVNATTVIKNIESVIEHLIFSGWTRRNILRAALKQPSLFCLKPATVINNIEEVVNHFSVDGLTRTDYLRAVSVYPRLFAQNPQTVIKNITEVVDTFVADGLTLSDYLEATKKHAALFVMNPKTIVENVRLVVDHFSADGLSQHDYLQAALKQPQLFVQKPATIIRNIEEVVNRFSADGLSQHDYLQAALKQPRLFAQKSETIIGHVNLLTRLCTAGILTVRRTSDEKPSNAAVLRFMVNTPQYFSLADDNFALREIYARVLNVSPSPSLLRKPRGQVENELALALGHADLKEPVPKCEPNADSGPHARAVLCATNPRRNRARSSA